MEINFGQTLKNMDGSEAKDEKDKPLTLRAVCVNALLLPPPEPKQHLSGPEKMKRYALATKIYHGKDPVRVDAEEITLMKQLIGDDFLPLVVGQAYDMLEGKKPSGGD